MFRFHWGKLVGEAREGNGDNGVGICTPDSDRCGGAVAVLGVDTCPSTAGSHARHLMKAREKKALFHAQTKTAEYGIEEAGGIDRDRKGGGLPAHD